MKMKWITTVALMSLGLGSLSVSAATAQNQNQGWRHDRDSRYSYGSRMRIPSGTPMDVRLDTRVSTDDMHAGDTWSGTIAQDVTADGRVVVPQGTPVSGVLTESVQGTHTTPARLGLALRQMDVNGITAPVRAETEPIVAGSHRAKKIGAIAGGAAAGALLGHAIGGDKGTLIGGALGGAAGYGATRHAFRTLVLKEGTVVRFTTTRGFIASR